MRERLTTLGEIAGATLVVAGLCMVAVPLGLVVGGACVVFGSWLASNG